LVDSFDVLGERPERRHVFTGELLAETDDAELQLIVEAAARDLSAPIALVTMVLDQIQFFRAQYGLPADLAAARGTHRDVSFCQLVVRDEDALEVTDAAEDTRIPQHFVREYDISAYLGVPIRVGDTVVGSLCVLDTEPRNFTEDERARLEELAGSVDERLSALAATRRSARADLTAKATAPALAQLRESLRPVAAGAEAGVTAITAIRSFLQLSAFQREGGSVPLATLEGTRAAAVSALEECDDHFHEIYASAEDCRDGLTALEHLTTPSETTRVSDILIAAQDLSRHSTSPIGGAPLPDLSYDPVIYSPRPLAVAILTSLLNGVAERLASKGETEGVSLTVTDMGATAEIRMSADGLNGEDAAEVGSQVNAQLGQDPSLAVRDDAGVVVIGFAVRPDEVSR
jgi:hypothetical protein